MTQTTNSGTSLIDSARRYGGALVLKATEEYLRQTIDRVTELGLTELNDPAYSRLLEDLTTALSGTHDALRVTYRALASYALDVTGLELSQPFASRRVAVDNLTRAKEYVALLGEEGVTEFGERIVSLEAAIRQVKPLSRAVLEARERQLRALLHGPVSGMRSVYRR